MERLVMINRNQGIVYREDADKFSMRDVIKIKDKVAKPLEKYYIIVFNRKIEEAFYVKNFDEMSAVKDFLNLPKYVKSIVANLIRENKN